ncbi:MAG TPA: DUF3180 domain-containing protein [Streptosporangiaceae bacterium]|jgi:hypothetical protein
MRPTRVTTLAVIVVIAAALTWGLLKAAYNSLPPLPWTGVPALLVVAVFETGAGRDLKRRIDGRKGLKPADPLVVSRMLVLGRATALAGALVAGVMVGFVIYLSGMLSNPIPRHDLINAAITGAAALVMTGAALYLEFCCRVPGDPMAGEDR